MASEPPDQHTTGLLDAPPDSLPLPPAELPRVILPMFPGGASEPFDSSDHLFEVRWDGLRALAFLEDGAYHLQDQSGRNITELFPELGETRHQIGARSAILDGVVVVCDETGRPDFAALDRRMRLSSAEGVTLAASRQPAAFIAFDLLYHDARSVMSNSLLRRRRLLRALVGNGGRLCVSDAVAAEGESFFLAARDMGIDAVIAKRKDSQYMPGRRAPSWLLVQDVPRQDVVVVGYVPDPDGRPFESLLLGVFTPGSGTPTYVGAVGGGFDRGTERLLGQALPGLRGGAEAPARAERVPPETVWVRPELVVSVKYSEWSAEGALRFPIFVGMHPEVDPHDCVRHAVLPPRLTPAPARARRVKVALPQLPFSSS